MAVGRAVTAVQLKKDPHAEQEPCRPTAARLIT